MGENLICRQRQVVHYFPIFPAPLMISSTIGICIWIHYTQTMILSITAALVIVANTANANNSFVLSQSVIATSVLFPSYNASSSGCVREVPCWRLSWTNWYTLQNQDTVGVSVHAAPYPYYPATCVDLGVVETT
ncbi:hypothetical protein VOLCADRAFT_97697 [Volvox carteri f. nagariensis]|uniref:Uncharacterized protein n=1 Tax=Volvox carteri f. nagariensis TaxID=3068 RepID=D8UDE9_VOLCA|nr:uncharacterized protein VOLCADRAFT_97697 [Volvox carteri f. nagariensis]EFJ42252.1 hypothetical protein VOLCADRAFT_97697 [Volvox carteri f. nagariensis]|eukprot:XP_002956650.1 hypothetical protein VOLCADRAFT_97697 [Volvox carteri f. nagariensis]